MEATLGAIVAGSVLALGAVRPIAYVPLWWACAGAGAVFVIRALLILRLRELLGSRSFAFHASGRWLTPAEEPAYGAPGWEFDLARPLLPRVPLLWPGVLFLVWTLVQLLPWGGRAISVSPADTWRGLAFLAALLSLHLASGAVFDRHRARRRMRALVAVLGLALGLLALTQHALGARRAYFAFESLEGGTPFGPFFNRNHFAGYMLLVVPTSFAVLARAWQRLLERVGARPPLRRLAAALGTAEGMRCVYASLPPVVGVSALIASTSRGALLACACGLLLVLATRRRERAFFALLAASVVAMALGWFGLARLEARFALFAADAPARTRVWKDALERAQGRLLAGTGFNTFGVALHRVPPLELPRGATPWPAELLQGGERPGYRAPEGLPGIEWYREAHNDYLQVLVESGVPGLLLALLAAFEVLRAARRDGWLLWALSAVLLHELVDFDLQIPAIAVVFVVLAATRRRPEVFRQA